MPDNDNIWPPPPKSAAIPAGAEARICPNCARKLLTQTSALCNWCGAKIDDPEYQMRAAQERQSLDQSERDRVQDSQQDKPKYGLFGRFVSKSDKPKGR